MFGTSGDPPTLGHQKILEWLATQYDLGVVWVSNNPFKLNQTALSHREAMMQLLVREINLPNLEMHPEISNARTLITVQQAQKIWQNSEFTLVVGADLVRQIYSWYRAEQLCRMVEILVVARQGYAIAEDSLQGLYAYGAKIKIANLEIPNTSSSDYRKKSDRIGIIPSIQTYIKTHNLYPWEETNPTVI